MPKTIPCQYGSEGASSQLLFCFLQLFDVDEDGYITEEEFSTILQASLGVPDLDVSGLFKEIAQGDSVSYGEWAVWRLTQFAKESIQTMGCLSHENVVALRSLC